MNLLYGAAVTVFLMIASFGAGWHFGGQTIKLATATAEVRQEGSNVKTLETDADTINQEAVTYAKRDIDPLPAPSVQLCHYTPSGGAAASAAAGPGAAAGQSLRAADPPGAHPDVGPPLVKIGHDADAQVAGLKDYIEHVCRVPAP